MPSLLLIMAISACGGGRSTPALYSVGGTLSGLASGANVVLQNSGGNDITVSANGNFRFSTSVANSIAYAVTVLTQPNGQTCAVTSGSGTVGAANVTSVQVTCATNTYTISGTVLGLNTGSQVTLLNNAGDPTIVTANGAFSFAAAVTYGGSYAVTVSTQPTGQTCTVTSGSGTVRAANVISVQVTCVINTYTISGVVSGLNPGSQVTVLNNAGNPTTVKTNGSFSFATPIPYGGSYAVTVGIHPPAQICTVTAAAGSSVVTNVSGVSVVCVPATESVIHTFDVNPDGISPRANIIQGSDGNFYGTTYSGGTSNLGTVFKITPAGVETVLHSFTAGSTDGSFPTAGLIEGSDGNFYGTTANGGLIGAGTVFKITPSGVESVLYAFVGTDGLGPFAPLVQGSDGNFYGTTSGGGPNFNGTVFKVTPAGVLTVLHSFTGGTSDGAIAYGGLVQGSDGNFYGTTYVGGTNNVGTVFKITPVGVETVLHSFAGGTDGSSPLGALIQGSDGNFYGTTYSGGTGSGGTVFKITPAGVETVLYFPIGFDGSSLAAAVVQASDGNFYGTAQLGGRNGVGAVFEITPAGVETTLYSFAGGTDANGPVAALIQGSDGNLYGTTQQGGASNMGTVFKITPAGVETVAHSFNSSSEGQGPVGLVQGSDGNIYGTTQQGGTTALGTVYKITPTGVETALYSFAGGFTDGTGPATPLVQGSDGNFYGTTQQGGANNLGAVFKITPAGVQTVLHSFAGVTDGADPAAALIQGSDGNFYGTTQQGGTNNLGTVFKITSTGVETVLYAFVGGTADGSNPIAALIQAGDGNFYGTTYAGGASNVGTVFKITPAGVETLVYTFAGGTSDGSNPHAGLIQGGDGNFYGTTYAGGASNMGTVFKITPSDVETTLYSFAGGTADGSNPNVPLIQSTDGIFYGATVGGGIGGKGSLFKITVTGVETVLYSFAGGTDGSNPSALIQGADGIFYGTTSIGGSSNQGTVFKF